MGKWYRGNQIRLVVGLLAVVLPLTLYNNCSPDGKLNGNLNGASEVEEVVELPPVVPPPLPPATPPPPPPPDPFAFNEVGGGGSALDSGLKANIYLFQDSDVSNLINRDGGASKQSGMRGGYGLAAFIDPNDQNKIKFFVVDRGNHRILIFNQVPAANNAMPDVVVGQPNFTSGLANAGQAATNAMGYSEPVHVSVCGDGKMLVSDRNNSRVLIYNTIPKANGASADLVVGQPDFTSNLAATTATGLRLPYGGYCFNKKLFINDRDNNRVLVYNTFPTTTNAAADFAIGQADLVTGTGACAANKLAGVYEIAKYGNELYFVEGFNHRITRYAAIPTAFGAVATNVIGQPNLTTCTPNQGLAAGPNTLNTPNSLAIGKNNLAVTDYVNNRILIFGLPVIADNPNALAVVGQPNFTTTLNYNPVTPTSTNLSKGLVFDNKYIWVNQGANNRVIAIPLPNGI